MFVSFIRSRMIFSDTTGEQETLEPPSRLGNRTVNDRNPCKPLKATNTMSVDCLKTNPKQTHQSTLIAQPKVRNISQICNTQENKHLKGLFSGGKGVGSKMKGVVVNTWIPVTFVINYSPHIPPKHASMGCCDRDLSLCAPPMTVVLWGAMVHT